MNLITVNYNCDRPTVLGRDLHKTLGVKTPYTQWFDRMKEYGFTENTDFATFHKNVIRTDGSKMPNDLTDHQLSIEMAKEICMIQRSEKGKQCRQYFIELEKQWNSPEMIMKRALEIANQRVEEMRQKNKTLETTIAVQTQQILELQPKASYYDVILNCKDLVSITEIAKDYGKSAKWLNALLHDLGVQFKQGGIWLLYQKYAECGYTNTRTHNYLDNNGNTHAKVHTYWTQKGRIFIYDLLKEQNILPNVEKSA